MIFRSRENCGLGCALNDYASATPDNDLDVSRPSHEPWFWQGVTHGTVVPGKEYRGVVVRTIANDPCTVGKISDGTSKTLLVGDEFLPALGEMDLTKITKIVVIGDPGDTGYQTDDQWVADFGTDDPNHAVDDRDACYQLYTSGTTGLPKGVELTHANFMHCLSESLAVTKLGADSVNLVCMPLFHISGSGWGVIGIYFGARSILLLSRSHGS